MKRTTDSMPFADLFNNDHQARRLGIFHFPQELMETLPHAMQSATDSCVVLDTKLQNNTFSFFVEAEAFWPVRPGQPIPTYHAIFDKDAAGLEGWKGRVDCFVPWAQNELMRLFHLSSAGEPIDIADMSQIIDVALSFQEFDTDAEANGKYAPWTEMLMEMANVVADEEENPGTFECLMSALATLFPGGR